MAEIGLGVRGTSANFNGFRVLAALLHMVVDVSQTAAWNRGRHLYSAGRPARLGIGPHSSFVWSFSLRARARIAVPTSMRKGLRFLSESRRLNGLWSHIYNGLLKARLTKGSTGSCHCACAATLFRFSQISSYDIVYICGLSSSVNKRRRCRRRKRKFARNGRQSPRIRSDNFLCCLWLTSTLRIH